MDLDKCIFIVPFDDAILKKALEEKSQQFNKYRIGN